MKTMITMCGYCGKQYEPKRETSKFCSDACRAKSHKREKKATAASTPAEGAVPVEQPWMPTKRESVLNKLLEDSVSAIFRMQWLAEKLEKCAIVEEILMLATQSRHVTFHNEIRHEVADLDMDQRFYDWDSYEARTGMVVAVKKRPQ